MMVESTTPLNVDLMVVTAKGLKAIQTALSLLRLTLVIATAWGGFTTHLSVGTILEIVVSLTKNFQNVKSYFLYSSAMENVLGLK